jgi:hypothetical protein
MINTYHVIFEDTTPFESTIEVEFVNEKFKIQVENKSSFEWDIGTTGLYSLHTSETNQNFSKTYTVTKVTKLKDKFVFKLFLSKRSSERAENEVLYIFKFIEKSNHNETGNVKAESINGDEVLLETDVLAEATEEDIHLTDESIFYGTQEEADANITTTTIHCIRNADEKNCTEFLVKNDSENILILHSNCFDKFASTTLDAGTQIKCSFNLKNSSCLITIFNEQTQQKKYRIINKVLHGHNKIVLNNETQYYTRRMAEKNVVNNQLTFRSDQAFEEVLVDNQSDSNITVHCSCPTNLQSDFFDLESRKFVPLHLRKGEKACILKFIDSNGHELIHSLTEMTLKEYIKTKLKHELIYEDGLGIKVKITNLGREKIQYKFGYEHNEHDFSYKTSILEEEPMVQTLPTVSLQNFKLGDLIPYFFLRYGFIDDDLSIVDSKGFVMLHFDVAIFLEGAIVEFKNLIKNMASTEVTFNLGNYVI